MAAGICFTLVVALSLRIAIALSSSKSVSLPVIPAVAAFVLFLLLYQIVSAVTLRHFANLIPLYRDDV